METRTDLIKRLLENFLQDLARSATALTHEDKIYFYETLTEYLKGVYNDMPYNEYFESIPKELSSINNKNGFFHRVARI